MGLLVLTSVCVWVSCQLIFCLYRCLNKTWKDVFFGGFTYLQCMWTWDTKEKHFSSVKGQIQFLSVYIKRITEIITLILGPLLLLSGNKGIKHHVSKLCAFKNENSPFVKSALDVRSYILDLLSNTGHYNQLYITLCL